MGTNVALKKRVIKIFFIFFIIFFIMSFRLAWIQFVKGEELHLKALNNRSREVPVEAKRGTIYDRNMREMAISISADYIYAIPPEVNRSGEAKRTSEILSKMLEIPEETIYKKITKTDSWFEYIARRVDFEKSALVKELKLPGINVAEESQRFYPNDCLAAHVLGFAGVDNQGLEGIETVYDEEIRGKRGSIIVEFDGKGREIPYAVHRYIPPEDGNNLVLTIDETIQFIAERELDALMVSSTQPKNASVIVMDPRNGEILALASRPAYNPNMFGEFPESSWRNIAVSNNYEPGSTFKIVTIAAALEEAVVNKEDRFNCTGSIKVGSENIKCWRSYNPHGSQSFVEGVQNSCNPVFVNIGLRLEEKQKGLFYNYIKSFGFGKKTELDLPGEAPGIMIPEAELKPINIATIAMGQGIAITPIQLVVALSAIANEGVIQTPHMVKEIWDKDGNLLEKVQPRVAKQVISKVTAQTTLEILETVVSEGTGRNAYIEGYRVGGKTGTAQKAGPGGYLQGKYVASFLGVAPVDDPRLVALVIVDEPQGYPYYGGTVAAPIFKRVVEDSLHYLGVAPQFDPKNVDKASEAKVSIPEVTGLSVAKAEKVLRSVNLASEFNGSGTIVERQNPASAEKASPGTKVVLYLADGEDKGEVVVPNLQGYRIYQAATLLEALGLKLQAKGSGWAVEQSPKANSALEVNGEVQVTFSEDKD